jgi:hypothetical protein
MRQPSPAPSNSSSFSCRSSDDEVIRGLKRLKIDPQYSFVSSFEDESNFTCTHKAPGSGAMILVPETQLVQKSNKEAQLREKMMKTLQSQLQQYQSQYASLSQGPSVSHCDNSF